jgi:hypothetical protein
MGSHDETDAFAPRITFLRAPRRWEKHPTRARREVAHDAGPRDARVVASEGKAAAVLKGVERRQVDGRKMKEELKAWMRRANVRRAPEAHFLDVETLRDLFVADRADHAVVPGGSSEENAVDVQVFGTFFGVALSGLFQGTPKIARRRGAIGVTCDAVEATRSFFPSRSISGTAETPLETEARREGARVHSAAAKARKRNLDPERSKSRADAAVGASEDNKTSHSRYLTELLKLRCGSELVRLRVFPDAKELTESFAANNAARTYLCSPGRVAEALDAKDPGVACLVVGDGNTPRTAALFAFLTKWHCIAVDPQMVAWATWKKRRNIDSDDSDDSDEGEGEAAGPEAFAKTEDARWGDVSRLLAFRKKIQEIKVESEKAVLVLVHAHVSIQECLSQVFTRSGRCSAVVLPCCNWYQKLRHPEGKEPLAEYDDLAVLSPQRTVRVLDDLPCGRLFALEPDETEKLSVRFETGSSNTVVCPRAV